MSNESTSPVTWEIVDGIARVTIDRPRALNALNRATLEGLDAAFDACLPAARALVLTGAGGRAFVAGADIAAMRDMSPTEAAEFSAYGTRVFRKLEQGPIPTLAAVNGFALGGGCELAMACDFIYATPGSRFGQPEVNLGLIPGFGGTQRLALRVGPAMAMELLVTGRMIDADEALRIGLCNRITASAESLMEEALATAAEIASRGPLAVRATRALVRHMQNERLDAGLRAESAEFGEMFATADAQEGMQAFLEKRKASFEGA